MTDQIIPGNRYNKAFSPRRLHHTAAHLTDLYSWYSGTHLHATLALTEQQHYLRNDRNGKKIYATDSDRFLPFFSRERKKRDTGCTDWQKLTGTAHLLSPFRITLKNVQP